MDHRLCGQGRACSAQEEVGTFYSFFVFSPKHDWLRYFFHATMERQESADYQRMEFGEDQEMIDGTVNADLKIPTTPESIEPKIEEAEGVDSELAEWFNVDAKPAAAEDSETEAESDADSNNDDVKEETIDDDWFQVPGTGTEPHDDDDVRDLNGWLHTMLTSCFDSQVFVHKLW